MKQEVILKWVAGVYLAAWAVTAPIHPLLLSVGVLVSADAFLGVWASVKTKGWSSFSSARLFDSIIKLCVYGTVIVTTWVVQTFMMHDILPIVKMITLAVGFVEVVSLLENAGLILGQPVFKHVINKLGSKNRHNPKGD